MIRPMGAGVSMAVRAIKAGTRKAAMLQSSKPATEDANNSPSILRIVVIAAKDLPAMDSNGLSDPYVTVEYGDQKMKTDVRKKSLAPTWSQVLDFPVWKMPPEIDFLQDSRLTIKCWDWNALGSHTFMGSVDIELEHLSFGDPALEGWHGLSDPVTSTEGGEVLLSIQWIERPEALPDAILSVHLLSGRDLVPLLEEGLTSAYTKIKMKGETFSTRVMNRTTEPEWQEIFEFKVFSSEIGISCLDFEVYDKGRFRDRLLGISRLNLEAITFDQGLEEWLPLQEKQKGGEVAKPKRRRNDEAEEDFG